MPASKQLNSLSRRSFHVTMETTRKPSIWRSHQWSTNTKAWTWDQDFSKSRKWHHFHPWRASVFGSMHIHGAISHTPPCWCHRSAATAASCHLDRLKKKNERCRCWHLPGLRNHMSFRLILIGFASVTSPCRLARRSWCITVAIDSKPPGSKRLVVGWSPWSDRFKR